jgi:phage baseplate assembly protein gpV
LGVTSEVSISYIGRSPVNDYWAVPKIGEQIVVSADDSNMTNVFWLQTEPYNSEGIASQTGEPMGFANRLDSVIHFDNTTRVFTISPVDGSYDVWVRGVLYTITEPISITIPSGHGGYNVYFDITGTLQVKTPYFDLEYEAPVSFIYWNTVSAIMFADERHGITLDWATHEYLHRTRGAAIASGFEVSGYTTTGTGNTVADGKITIANGTFFDEDLQIDITHSATPVVETWQQRLQSGAYIPVYYKDSAGWQKATTTQYPLKFATTGTGYPQYNLNASSLVQMDNNRYGIAWILATNGLTEPVISVMGQAQYSNIADAHAALWSNVTMTGFPSFEFRPLWKVIFQAQNGSAIKAAIRAIDDLRTFQGTAASGGTSVTSLENLVDVTLTNPVNGETLVYNGSQWVNTSSQTIRYFNARDLVPTSSDVGKLIIMDSGSWVQTVQIDSDLGLTPGQRIDFVRIGTNAGGTVTFFGVDVFLNGTPGLKLRARYSAATLICLFTNQYLLIGDLDA